MSRLRADKIAFAFLGLVSIAVIGWGASIAYARTRVYRATFAAGSSSAESFVLMQALKTVVESHHPRVKIAIAETGGTADSLSRLNRGDVQFAVAQADAIANRSARAVAFLFEDVIQILVPKDSGARRFADLKGKRIALPRTGGQYQSFLFLAQHSGLGESDFSFVGSDDADARRSFVGNRADAFFAVRPLHSEELAPLTEGGVIRFVPLDDAQALLLNMPAYGFATILKSTYRSDPSVPEADTPTVSVDRLLLAREDVPKDVVFAVAQVLMERRNEIAQVIPDAKDQVRRLVASIRPPTGRGGFSAPVHPGAALYFENGSLAYSEGEIVTACAVVCLLLGLWMVAFHMSVRQRQKSYSDEFNQTILKLVEEAQSTAPHRPIESTRGELLKLFTRAVKDLCEDRISERSFQSSHAVWQIAFDSLRWGAQSAAGSLTPRAAASPQGEKSQRERQRRWSLWRDT